MGLPESAKLIPISAKVEEELINFSDAEARDLLAQLGIKESGLTALIHAAYRYPGSDDLFYRRPQGSPAWTIQKEILRRRPPG